MRQEKIITAIVYFFILLFMYTAISKLLAFNVTLFDMRRNPLLGNLALFWTVSVPAVEILISVLLFIPKTRKIGLWATLILISGFTGYVGTLLLSDYNLPCTCGGIFRELSWRQHLWVNLGLIIVALKAIILEYNLRYRKKEEIIAS